MTLKLTEKEWLDLQDRLDTILLLLKQKQDSYHIIERVMDVMLILKNK